MYFTHQRRGYTYYSASNQAAALELCHVRPPPSPTATQPAPATAFYGQQVVAPQAAPANAIAFNSIANVIYSSGGLLIAANNVSDEMDVLLVAAPDIGRVARAVAEGSSTQNGNASRPFSEVASTITIEGRTWGLAEITRQSPMSAEGVVGLNELATQANSARREWVVLTNMGANVIVRQRPVDTLLGVLEGTALGGGGGNSEVGIFFERSVYSLISCYVADGENKMTASVEISRALCY